jgi:hypothetical protein
MGDVASDRPARSGRRDEVPLGTGRRDGCAFNGYESPNDPALMSRTADRADRDQEQLWSIASLALNARGTKLGLSLLVRSLNDTIEIIAKQRQASASHVPTAIVVLTLCLVTLGTLSLGLRFALNGSRPLILSIIYVVAYAIVIEMMIDSGRPNTGLVTVSLTR